MPESIKKRDGRLVPYDEAKIASAIDRAFVAAESGKGEDEAERLAKIVTREMNAKESNETPSVEDIQDQVEQVLIAEGYAKTAKAYILYRAEHAKIRQSEADLMDIYKELTFSYSKDADIKRENANINGDTAAGKLASALGAEKLVILTDIEGLCNDIKVRDVISYLNIQDVKALKDKGTIAGGMIPKVDCCVEAIEEGVTSVHIIDGRKPHSVLYEAFTTEGTGTTIGTAQPSVGIKW